ncbi:MAG TPA: septum formation family protein [Acidimicrobiia bacterium]|jgi:hypothetical protein
MNRCPKCRTKYNPTYTASCAECGALLVDLAQPTDSPADRTIGRPVKRARRGVLELAAPFAGWIVLGLFALSGVVWALLTDAGRDESGTIVDQGLVSVFEVRVGDCVNLSDDDIGTEEVAEFVGVPCGQPHGMEIFGIVTHPGNTSVFPGRETLEEFADESCVGLYQPYVGVSFDVEPLIGVTYFTPTRSSWAEGDRGINCALIAFDESDLVGSMKGQGQIHARMLSVGCYDLPEDRDRFLGFHPRSCDESHTVEVYSVVRERSSMQARYDEAALLEFGDERCEDDFYRYLGSSRGDPNLTWSYFYPSSESWEDGDRKFFCFLTRVDEAPFSGSLENSGGVGADA